MLVVRPLALLAIALAAAPTPEGEASQATTDRDVRPAAAPPAQGPVSLTLH